jgi:hypothetical protein
MWMFRYAQMSVLRDQLGYATGLMGKWHLFGDDAKDYAGMQALAMEQVRGKHRTHKRHLQTSCSVPVIIIINPHYSTCALQHAFRQCAAQRGQALRRAGAHAHRYHLHD